MSAHGSIASRSAKQSKHSLLTRDVGGDLGEGRLSEALGGAGADRHQVGGSWVQA